MKIPLDMFWKTRPSIGDILDYPWDEDKTIKVKIIYIEDNNHGGWTLMIEPLEDPK